MIIARSIHVAANGIILFFFMILFHCVCVCVCVCVCIHIFIHSSVNGHLGCFHTHALVIVNNAAMNIGYTYLSDLEFSPFLNICPGMGVAGPYDNSIFSF